jgi:hypothetical protein
MLDFFEPLGRPPLDTYSPTQVVRTAEPMPSGVWEFEGGLIHQTNSATLAGTYAAVHGGLLPGFQLDVAWPQPSGGTAARRTVGLRFAPIPALWSFDIGADLASFKPGDYYAIEGGTTLEIGLPLVTPRLAPRITYQAPGIGGMTGSWLPRVALGAETHALKLVTLGLDYDYGFAADSTLSLGARFRPFGNFGVALFASSPMSSLGSAVTLSGGAIAGVRF